MLKHAQRFSHNLSRKRDMTSHLKIATRYRSRLTASASARPTAHSHRHESPSASLTRGRATRGISSDPAEDSLFPAPRTTQNDASFPFRLVSRTIAQRGVCSCRRSFLLRGASELDRGGADCTGLMEFFVFVRLRNWEVPTSIPLRRADSVAAA